MIHCNCTLKPKPDTIHREDCPEFPKMKNQEKQVFVVTMYRGGDINAHSYVLGVWSSEEFASGAIGVEEVWRGGKYKGAITPWVVDANEWDAI